MSSAAKQSMSLVFRGTRARGRTKRKRKPVDPIPKWNIVRGDLVHVIAGKDKGKQGTVIKVARDTNRLHVDGVMLQQRRIKGAPGKSGRVIVKAGAIHYSNVQLVDPQTGHPTRVGARYLEDGTRVRVAKGSGAIIPKPEFVRKKPAPTESSPKCTSPEVVLEKTWDGDLMSIKKMLGDVRFEV